MKKQLLLKKVLLFLAAFVLLYSCRIEDELIAEKNSNSNARKFKALTSKNGEPVNYSHGFKYLLERYDKLHSTQFTRKTVMKNNKFAGKNIPEFIEFNIHSQDLIRNDGKERWIMYPVIKNGEVSGIAIAVLKEEETNLQFYKLDEDGDYYKEVIGLFRTQYNNSIIKEGMNKNSERCGFEGEEPCDIEEVIIRVPGNGPGGDQGMYKPRDWGAGGGYCDTYGNCGGSEDGDDGGGGPPNTPTDTTKTKDPCEEMKLQNLNTDYSGKIEELDKSSVLNQKKETGYSEKKSGGFTKLKQGTSSENSHSLQIPVSSDTKGYIHTHTNEYEDGTDTNGNIRIKTPIKMFSPADVNTLMTMAGFVDGDDYSDLYGTMVSSAGNYTIKFTGTSTDVVNGFDAVFCRDHYLTYFKRNSTRSKEYNFLTFMKDEMQVKGVRLYKIKTNGKIIEYKLSENGRRVEKTDCPD